MKKEQKTKSGCYQILAPFPCIIIKLNNFHTPNDELVKKGQSVVSEQRLTNSYTRTQS